LQKSEVVIFFFFYNLWGNLNAFLRLLEVFINHFLGALRNFIAHWNVQIAFNGIMRSKGSFFSVLSLVEYLSFHFHLFKQVRALTIITLSSTASKLTTFFLLWFFFKLVYILHRNKYTTNFLRCKAVFLWMSILGLEDWFPWRFIIFIMRDSIILIGLIWWEIDFEHRGWLYNKQ
jgi:hypothetical protein